MNNIYNILFFFIGANLIKSYLILGSILILLEIFRLNYLKISKAPLIVYLFGTLGVILPTIMGIINERISTTENPFNLLIVLIFNLYFFIFIYSTKSHEKQNEILIFFILGMFFESFVTIIYSLHNGIIYGYGNVFNPFTGEIENSPPYSLNLIIASALFINNIFNKKMVALSLLFLSFCILGGFYLGGRTYFICILFILIAFLIRSKRKLKVITIISASLISLFLLTPKEIDFFEQTFSRISDGIESKRFEHLEYGINIFIEYPFGNFSVNQSIEQVDWFHNLFLDAARLGGWIPAFSLITFYSACFIFFILSIKKINFFYNLLFFVSFLIMMQDVIIEAMHKYLWISFLIFIYQYSYLRDQKNQN